MAVFPSISRHPFPVTVTPGSLTDPGLYLDDFLPGEIPVTIQEFDRLCSENQSIIQPTPARIHPIGVDFGMKEEDFRKIRPRPFLLIDNNEMVKGHLIYLQRQRIEKIPIAVQYHFLSGLLFCVVYEYNRQLSQLPGVFRLCLNGFHKSISDSLTTASKKLVWQDPGGNLLVADALAGFRAVYFSAERWIHPV